MARTHEISIAIYKKHLALYRYLNDAWILTMLTRPQLKQKAEELRASLRKGKRRYTVPKRGGTVDSRRTDADLANVLESQFRRGIYETNIVSIVSRTEAYIQECVSTALISQPKKLSLLSGNGIPLDLFLAHTDRDDVIESYVASRCQELMFGKPVDYLAKVAKVLSIEIAPKVVDPYIEIKATRDVIVHNMGRANRLYLDNAGPKARGQLDDELPIDENYFTDVITSIKALSGSIQRETEKVYG